MASRIVQYFADKLKSMKEYPITLTKAVYDESGNRLDNKLQEINNSLSDINNLNVRYNPETDCLDVIIDGNTVPTNIRCYAQSTNWFLNGVVNEDFLGLPVFAAETYGRPNSSTYRTDGYFSLDCVQYSSGGSGVYSSKKIPIGVYSSMTIKFVQTAYLTDSGAYAFCVGFTDSHYSKPSFSHTQLGQFFQTVSSALQEITFSLSSYNNNGVELYLSLTGITKTKIYEITFNK